jgi:ubiquinone/menaquinone biosynthesis C-methylase UbiE
MQDKKAKKILNDIETGYDMIADKFSGTRAFMWRDLGLVKDLEKSGDKVLDFGCGSGRLVGFFCGKYKSYVGVDISQKLIDIAKQRYHSEKTNFVKLSNDFSRLPFKDSYFDIVFSIAVFHHFPSREYALDVVDELHRVLKPGGKIVITVWNLWQKQYLKFHNKSKKEWAGAKIPFISGEKVFKRYHHPFETKELKKFLEESGFKIKSCTKNYNIICVASKK